MISIVVCTYNRAGLLARVLRTLQDQSLNRNEYEVIVVDNNSTDDTRAVVEEFSRRYSNVRYCYETKQGLSYARNRGWQEARGEYVGYTDDDCRAPRQWLEIAKKIINRQSPSVFGGPYFAYYDVPKPRWFKDLYGSRSLGDEARILKPNEFLMGGNIFFRRGLLDSFGGFDVNLGMNGDRIAYGEEVMLQRRVHARRQDQPIFYDPDLYVHHLVRPEKMKMRWLLPSFFAKGQYVYLASLKDEPADAKRFPLLAKALKVGAACVKDLTLGTLRRDRRDFPFKENYFYEHTSQYLRVLGRLYAQYQQLLEQQKLR